MGERRRPAMRREAKGHDSRERRSTGTPEAAPTNRMPSDASALTRARADARGGVAPSLGLAIAIDLQLDCVGRAREHTGRRHRERAERRRAHSMRCPRRLPPLGGGLARAESPSSNFQPDAKWHCGSRRPLANRRRALELQRRSNSSPQIRGCQKGGGASEVERSSSGPRGSGPK